MNASFITCPIYKATESGALGWTGPRRTREMRATRGEGLPTFLRRFSLDGRIVRATIEATALGIYELWMNGTRVGHRTATGDIYDELKPGSVDFDARVYSDRYDLTPYLSGENTLVAVVASGWYSGRISFGKFGMKPLCFACEVTLCYEDGRVEHIYTDEAWKCTVAGPTLFADLYDGEYTDARIPHPAECVDAYSWQAVGIYQGYTGVVEPRLGPPLRLRADLTRRAISAVLWRRIDEDGTTYGSIRPRSKRVGNDCEEVTLRVGEHLTIDLGQNFAGVPCVVLSAASGTEIHLTVGEMLNDSGSRERGSDGARGTIYVENYRSARAAITYVAHGGGQERYAPQFTYYGFRYVDITATEDIIIHRVTGEVMTSDMPETGHIVTDNAQLNQFISNAEWGRRSNYVHVPTDCPQRDERLGWTADTHIFAGAAAYMSDIRAFMRKWLADARDAQKRVGGAYPDVIPHVLDDSFVGRAAWGDAGIILPHVLYEMYGDTETMREHYASMEWYMEYLSQFDCAGGGTAYGDWLSYEETDKRYIAVCFYAYDAYLMERYSRILSLSPGDAYARRAIHYHALREKILAHFTSTYIKDGALIENSQTAYILALHFGLIAGEAYAHAKTALCRKIKENGHCLSTGFLGTAYLAATLTEIGETQLAYSLVMQTRDPSWLYSVLQGATTVWERWNSYTRERGFGDVSMNSFNHYAYGAVVEWLYRTAAGISTDPENPGFGHIILSPMPDMRRGETLPEGQTPLRYVRAAYDSIVGRIESGWHYEGETFVYTCTIPNGATATICFPAVTGGALDPMRRELIVNGVRYTVGELCGTNRGGIMEFELPAGEYTMY